MVSIQERFLIKSRLLWCTYGSHNKDKDLEPFLEQLWIDRTLQFENENKCWKSPKNLRIVEIKVPVQALIVFENIMG